MKAFRICLLSLICLYLQQFLRCSSVNYHFRKLIISAIHTMIIFRLRYVDHLVSCVCWPWLLEIWRMSCYVKNWEKGVEIVYSAQNFILYGLSSYYRYTSTLTVLITMLKLSKPPGKTELTSLNF